tara:strand:+ start:42 stop:506 length:465 start_codon:yes stop_codon:yes gene_type:complete
MGKKENVDKKEYVENHDTLVTFGEEAYTMRKDDPRTKEGIKKSKKLKEEKMSRLIKEEGYSLFSGLNLSNKREEDETYEDYKARMKLNKMLQIIYKKLGREECMKQYPQGFRYAIEQTILDTNKKNAQPQMTATMTNKDGTAQEVPVIINNEKK